MRGGRVLALATMLLGVAIVATPSSAAPNSIRLSVTPASLLLAATPGAATSSTTLNVTITTAVAATLNIDLLDVVADDAGNWAKAPRGSTSYSIDDYLVVDTTSVSIEPGPDPQRIPVAFSMPVAQMNEPRVGIITATLIPTADGASADTAVNQGLNIDTAIVAEAAPQAITEASDVKVSIEGTGMSITSARTFTAVDSAIPDLFGIVDHGPAAAIARYRNNGDFIVDAQTTFDFGTVGPGAVFSAGDGPGDVFYTVNQVHQYALPGQPALSGADSLVRNEGMAPIDTLPFIGFVKVTATTTGTLGPLASTPVVQSAVFLVFPWKEALVLLALIVLWVLFRRWRRNRRDRKNQTPPAAETREPVEMVT